MSNKHTPGPWVQGTSKHGRCCVWLDGHTEPENTMGPADIWIDCGTEFNARLIAAAPDLLEAISKFVAFAERHGEVVFSGGGMSAIDAMNACTTKARAAIAKATGGTA